MTPSQFEGFGAG